MAILARRTLKFFFFIALSMVLGRLIHPAAIVGDNQLIRLTKAIYGQVNAENIYDIQFYIDFPVILILTIVAYVLIMKAVRHFRKSSFC